MTKELHGKDDATGAKRSDVVEGVDSRSKIVHFSGVIPTFSTSRAAEMGDFHVPYGATVAMVVEGKDWILVPSIGIWKDQIS